MAYVTKEDGIRDFNNHDAAGFFKYIDKMLINSDFTLTRIPKDSSNPGILDLNSTWKMVPAYVNAYVDAFNLKYKSQTPTTYAVSEAAKNNYTSVISTALGSVDASNAGIPTSDNTGINGGVGAITNDAVTTTSKFPLWIIIVAAIVALWWFIKKRRRK